jgi:hypothetical protein
MEKNPLSSIERQASADKITKFKRLVDIDTDEQKQIIKDAFGEFAQMFQPVLEKYSDVHISAKDLGEIWKNKDGKAIHEQTINRYSELANDPLPRLKNGKYSLKDACEWLYQSRWVQTTAKGKKLYNQIIQRYGMESR